MSNSGITLRRPRIDVRPDQPLTFRGFRIARSGAVYATTTSMTHGRTNPNYEVYVGSVERDGREWLAATEDGNHEFASTTQDGAASSLVRFVEEHQA